MDAGKPSKGEGPGLEWCHFQTATDPARTEGKGTMHGCQPQEPLRQQTATPFTEEGRLGRGWRCMTWIRVGSVRSEMSIYYGPSREDV